MQRLLVVGGAGYFGARLAGALARRHEVVVTRRSAAAAVDAWLARSGLQSITYDSARMPAIPVTGQFDAIIHLAMASAADAARDTASARQRALAVADHAVELVDQGRAKRLLYLSTFHVYGAGGRARYCESDEAAPIHPYGAIHLECERLLLQHPHVLVLRPSNLVGAPAHGQLGEQARLLFLDLCRQAAAGTMRLQNDGLSFRDFLPFADAIAAVELLLAADLAGHRLFNLARGRAQRLDRIAQLIRSLAPGHGIEFGAGVDSFRAPFTIDTKRLCDLGWRAQASLEAETADILRFFR